jgi:hypothetical protein
MNELKLIISDKAELEALSIQLEREFSLIGYQLRVIDPSVIEAIVQQLTQFLSEVKSSTQLWSIIYRIDVSEKEIKKSLATKSISSLEERLAWLIAERCYQKVISKRYFSNPKKPIE